MDEVIYIVKIIAILQVALITLSVVILYLTKIYFHYNEQSKAKKRNEIAGLLDSYYIHRDPLSPDSVRRLKNHVYYVLLGLMKIEQNHPPSPELEAFKEQLSIKIFRPAAKTLATSRDWYNRYIATLCYYYGFDADDDERLLQLVKDDTTLVVINAAKVAVKFYNPLLINAMIDVFSQERRLRQNMFAEIIMREITDISPIIFDRLKIEKDPYVRTFCYRLLQEIPPKDQVIKSAKYDLNSESLDLKIATLNYISSADNPLKNDIIYPLSTDPNKEVRAVVAKALGNVDSKESLRLLEHMLNDSQWFVRVNAAHSLGKKGEQGIAVLKNQSPEKDRFAYETAQEVLMQLEQNKTYG